MKKDEGGRMKDEPGKQRDIALAMRCGGIRFSNSVAGPAKRARKKRIIRFSRTYLTI
jgi:hypothetical protein